MPVITDVQRQKHSPDRYSIFIDGDYSFSLSDLDFSLSDLKVGQVLKPEQLASFQQGSTRSKAYERAVHFLSFRQRTEFELRNFLKRKGYEEAVIQQALDRLSEAKLVDDAQFVRDWVATRQSLKPRSRKMIILELKEKGVKREVIEAGLINYGREAELEAIKQIATKKLTHGSTQDQRKLTDYLIRQGFNFDLIKQALDDLEIDDF